MDAGRFSYLNKRIPHFKYLGTTDQEIHSAGKHQQSGSTENTVDVQSNSNHSSPPQVPRYVKSLVSGSVLHPEETTAATGNTTNIGNKSNNMLSAQHRITERVVINSKIQQNSKPKKDTTKSTPRTSPTTPSAFFASFGACAGSGAASFLDQGNEETRFEYYFGHENYSSNEQDIHARGVQNCYGSPGRCSKNSDEKKDEELMVQFSSNRVPLTKPIGGGTSSGGGDVMTNSTYDAFSSARRLLFGQGESSKQKTKEKQQSSFRCNSDNNILCSSSEKRSYCLSQTKNAAPCGADNNNSSSSNNNNTFLRWYSQEAPITPHSHESIVKTSVSPSKTIYAAAYDDNDAAQNTEDIDDIPLHPSALLRIEDGASHHEIRYWRQRLQYAKKHYGNGHSSTADAYFNLGRAQMNLSPNNSTPNRKAYINSHGLPIRYPKEAASQQKHRYDLAIENLTIAHGIWERKHGSKHLAVGRALDSLALAMVKRANHYRTTKGASSTAIEKDLRYARRLLDHAFSVRVHHLGVWHVDTVETYNKIAGVLLHLGLLTEACRAYREVFLVRRAIFGNRHPSVAISAHALANIHYKRGNIRESLAWYEASLEVYEGMGLSYRHPAVTQLLRDQSRLEKYMDLEV